MVRDRRQLVVQFLAFGTGNSIGEIIRRQEREGLVTVYTGTGAIAQHVDRDRRWFRRALCGSRDPTPPESHRAHHDRWRRSTNYSTDTISDPSAPTGKITAGPPGRQWSLVVS